jgi:hypothetical protein
VYKVSVVARDAGYCFLTWDRLALAIWRLSATRASVAEMTFVVRALMAKHDEPCSFLGIVEPTSPPPDEKARSELAKFSREVVPDLAMAIIVGEGGGFRASLVRAVGVTLTTLMPHRVPFKFLSSVEDAITLIAPHLSPGAGGIPGLRRAIADVRAQFPLGAGSGFSAVPPSLPSKGPGDDPAQTPAGRSSNRPR